MPKPESLTIVVRVKPGASRTRVGGRHDGPHGPSLIAAVREPAVDGRATEAARRALAEALDVAPAQVRLRAGATARDKLFLIENPPADVDIRLTRLRTGSRDGVQRPCPPAP
jgi:uncharacterized protein YggU (UPF0235/DUF167 family)